MRISLIAAKEKTPCPRGRKSLDTPYTCISVFPCTRAKSKTSRMAINWHAAYCIASVLSRQLPNEVQSKQRAVYGTRIKCEISPPEIVVYQPNYEFRLSLNRKAPFFFRVQFTQLDIVRSAHGTEKVFYNIYRGLKNQKKPFLRRINSIKSIQRK